MSLADEPRVARAWKCGWDAGHYARLLRWRDEGFSPNHIYDIGAHDGRWSEMAYFLFPNASFYLFEPQSELQSEAQRRRPPQVKDWTILPFALGEREERSVLHRTENSAASSLLAPLADRPTAFGVRPVRNESITTVRLDDLVERKSLPKPDLMKIDVQGYEARVLLGGEKTVRASRRLIVEASLEAIYTEQALMPEVLSILSRWGFSVDDLGEACRDWRARKLWQVDLWMKRASAA